MSVSSLSQRSSVDTLRTEPDLLVPAVEGPMVWAKTELANYVVSLNAAEIEDIRMAVVTFKLTGLPRESINKTTFKLSEKLAAKLATLKKEINQGQGVQVLRGLNKANFNDEEWVIADVGVCAYIFEQRATDDYANQTLSHIRDATHDKVPDFAKDIGLAGSKLTVRMDYHCDRFSGDVISLCVKDDGGPRDGGEQYVVSFWKIYNHLLENEPTVLETMTEPNWPFELKQKDAPPHLERGPILFFADGKPICQMVKAPLIGGPQLPRSKEMPALSIEQHHALEVVEDLARCFGTQLDRQNGDIQFINNLSIMHARSAYGGDRKQPSSRHLMRMFLRDPETMWKKPKVYNAQFEKPFLRGRKQEIPVIDTDPWRKISGRESHG
ncbi:Clavaminate synthase-like protein [Lojkania enalia]|uniref:Clavaminate synthase-like protein n=1 Tax=Lojkania enalia TaxID=147567 RepID=A0A9P4KGH7_9PLEO|nr:Clavaminate synthase-like protein [Didymosphaeria enalia]